MSSRVFRYKNKPAYAYTPGLAVTGVTGGVGNSGDNGTALYFCDYDLNNSYNIDFALTKMDDNQILSSSSHQTTNGRPYRDGDIILTNTQSVYIVKNADEGSVHKFKIVYAQNLKSEADIDANKIKCIKIVDSSTMYSPAKNDVSTFMVGNAATGYIESKPYRDSSNAVLKEISLRCSVYADCSFGYDASLNDKYRIFAHLYFKNTKSYTADAYNNFDGTVVEQLKDSASFYKKLTLEITAASSDPSANMILTRQYMDSMHLFGNEIKINKIDDGSTFYYAENETGEMYEDPNEYVDGIIKYSGPIDDFKEGTDGLIAFSEYADGSLNVRGGDSAYFSSITDSSAAFAEMRNFLRDSANNFAMISLVDRTTKDETYIIPDASYTTNKNI